MAGEEFFAETTLPTDRWVELEGIPGVEFRMEWRSGIPWVRYRFKEEK